MSLNKSSKRMKLLFFILCLGGVISCSKEKSVDLNENTLYIGGLSKIKGFDPIHSNDLYTSREISRVYEGLMQFHYLKRPYELTTNLAAKMPQVSDDGLTYTFEIKKGVRFQDDQCFPQGKGRELVAEDFVYSIKRVADPHHQSVGWWLFDGKLVGLNEWREKYADKPETNYDEMVSGLKALDKYTLQFKLTGQSPQFLYGLAMTYSYALPRECVEFYGKEFINHPVGTGAFMIEKPYDQSNKIVYIKNPTYREEFFPSEASPQYQHLLSSAGKRLPLADKVVVTINVEENTRWLNFKKGNVDYLLPPKDNFSSAIENASTLSAEFKKKGVELEKAPSLDVTYVAFNHHFPLFGKNKKLRQAMSLAYDGEKLNELFYNGTAVKAESVIPPGIAGHIESYKSPYRKFDLEKAKKMLAEAGYPNGKGLPSIVYDTHSSPSSRQMGEYFRKSMEEIGIDVKVQTHPFPELQKRIKTKESMIYGIAWIGDYPDAENFLQLLYGPNGAPGANGSNFDYPPYNALFKKAVVMQDSPERTALYEKLYVMAAEEVPWIFGVHKQNYYLVHGWLKNFVVTDFDHGIEKYLAVDLEKKAQLLKKF